MWVVRKPVGRFDGNICSELQRPASGAILHRTTQRVSRMVFEMMVLELERQEKKWSPKFSIGLPHEHFWPWRQGGRRGRRSFCWRRVRKTVAGRQYVSGKLYCTKGFWQGLIAYQTLFQRPALGVIHSTKLTESYSPSKMSISNCPSWERAPQLLYNQCKLSAATVQKWKSKAMKSSILYSCNG